jgi:hypothetical protein
MGDRGGSGSFGRMYVRTVPERYDSATNSRFLTVE